MANPKQPPDSPPADEDGFALEAEIFVEAPTLPAAPGLLLEETAGFEVVPMIAEPLPEMAPEIWQAGVAALVTAADGAEPVVPAAEDGPGRPGRCATKRPWPNRRPRRRPCWPPPDVRPCARAIRIGGGIFGRGGRPGACRPRTSYGPGLDSPKRRATSRPRSPFGGVWPVWLITPRRRAPTRPCMWSGGWRVWVRCRRSPCNRSLPAQPGDWRLPRWRSVAALRVMSPARWQRPDEIWAGWWVRC